MLRLLALFIMVLLLAEGAVAARAPLAARQAPPTKQQMEEVRSNPRGLLDKFPNGGPALASQVARLVVADPTLVEPILSTVPVMTPPQTAAVGAGMARAARSLSVKNPAAAKQISQKVSETGSKRMATTFKAVGPSPKALEAAKVPPLQPLPPMSTHEIGTDKGERFSRIGPNPRYNLDLMPKDKQDNTEVVNVDQGDVENSSPIAELQQVALGAESIQSRALTAGTSRSSVVVAPTPTPTPTPPSPVVRETPIVRVITDSSSSNGVVPISP